VATQRNATLMNTEIYTAIKGATLKNPFFKMILELAVIIVIANARIMAILKTVSFLRIIYLYMSLSLCANSKRY